MDLGSGIEKVASKIRLQNPANEACAKLRLQTSGIAGDDAAKVLKGNVNDLTSNGKIRRRSIVDNIPGRATKMELPSVKDHKVGKRALADVIPGRASRADLAY